MKKKRKTKATEKQIITSPKGYLGKKRKYIYKKKISSQNKRSPDPRPLFPTLILTLTGTPFIYYIGTQNTIHIPHHKHTNTELFYFQHKYISKRFASFPI